MKQFIRIIIILVSFSLLNSLIIYITGSIRYGHASQEEIRLRYVNAPDFILAFGISFLLLSVLYIFFRVITYIYGRYNVWLLGLVVLLINMGILYFFASLVTDVFSLKFLFNFILYQGMNFFIPFTDQWLSENLFINNKKIPP